MKNNFPKNSKIIDISLALDNKTIIYPKNTEFKIKEVNTGTSYLSEVTMGTHMGTHIDMPRHVSKKGLGVGNIDLSRVFGSCRVLDLTQVHGSVKIEDLKKYKIKKGERILVKTKNSIRGFKIFYDDYVYLDGDAAEYLESKKIGLFGIDYLSVKQKGSADRRSHDVLLKNDIYIVEGIDLSKVEEGEYFFSGLPLKFGSIDGAPIRAILVK